MILRGSRERASCPRGERNGKVSEERVSESRIYLSVAITDWNERGGDGSPITRIPLLLLENTENNHFREISPIIPTAHGKRDKTGACFGIASAEIKGNSWNASSYLWCLELGATMLGRGMYTEYVTFHHAFVVCFSAFGLMCYLFPRPGDSCEALCKCTDLSVLPTVRCVGVTLN